MKASEAFKLFASKCPHQVCCETPQRPGNALNIEHFTVFPCRCKLKVPEKWSHTKNPPSAARWLMSGGEPTVFGPCMMQSCELGHEWCPVCGHRRESHFNDGPCRVTESGTPFPCGCEFYFKKDSTRLTDEAVNSGSCNDGELLLNSERS